MPPVQVFPQTKSENVWCVYKKEKKSCTFPNKVTLQSQHSLLALSNLPDLSLPKVCSIKKETKSNQVFGLIKSSKIIFIFLPEFYLIIWLMASPKNFEKIPILKT